MSIGSSAAEQSVMQTAYGRVFNPKSAVQAPITTPAQISLVARPTLSPPEVKKCQTVWQGQLAFVLPENLHGRHTIRVLTNFNGIPDIDRQRALPIGSIVQNYKYTPETLGLSTNVVASCATGASGFTVYTGGLAPLIYMGTAPVNAGDILMAYIPTVAEDKKRIAAGTPIERQLELSAGRVVKAEKHYLSDEFMVEVLENRNPIWDNILMIQEAKREYAKDRPRHVLKASRLYNTFVHSRQVGIAQSHALSEQEVKVLLTRGCYPSC